jgi:hypothetical protein
MRRRLIMLVALPALIAGCPERDSTSARAPDPRSATAWRDRCAIGLGAARASLATDLPAMATATIAITRAPQTTVRFEARTSDRKGHYDLVIGEDDPNGDAESDVTEEPWKNWAVGFGEQPVVARWRLHQNRFARLEATGVSAADARRFAAAFEPAAEACLIAAERVASHDFYIVGTALDVVPIGARADAFAAADRPEAIVVVRVEEAERGAPITAGTTRAIAIADAAAFRAIIGKKKSFWLRRDVEGRNETFAFAKTIPMVDEADICPVDAGPRVPSDAGADAQSEDDDGCP